MGAGRGGNNSLSGEPSREKEHASSSVALEILAAHRELVRYVHEQNRILIEQHGQLIDLLLGNETGLSEDEEDELRTFLNGSPING